MKLRRWPWLLPLAALVGMSCEDHAPSEMVVLLSGDLSTGDPQTQTSSDIDTIEFSGIRGNFDIFQFVDVGRGGQGLSTFPASTVLYDQPEDSVEPGTVGTLEIRGRRSGDPENLPALAQRFSFSLSERETRMVRVPLQLSCLGVSCEGLCVDGLCQDRYVLDPKALPLYDEATDPAKHRDKCMDVSTKGCFANARRYPSAALQPLNVIDPQSSDSARCGLKIDDSDLATDDIALLNVAVVWAESRGRYGVLDRFSQPDPATPWRSTAGSWSISRDPKESFAVLSLPEGICRQSPLGGKGRVVDILVSKGDASCASKSPSREVCDHLPSEAQGGEVACASRVLKQSGACLACVSKQLESVTATCKEPRCVQTKICTETCQSLNPGAKCAELCSASSCSFPGDTGDTGLAAYKAALVKCKGECKDE